MSQTRRWRALIGMVLAVGLLAAPATANAATGPPPPPLLIYGSISLSVGSSAGLTARLLATVPVDVTCKLNALGIAAGASTTPDGGSFVNVSLQEASGRGIANGFGSVFGFLCDGVVHHFLVPVLANGCCPSPPWHGGTALVTADAEAFWCPCDPNTGQPTGGAFGTAGPQKIRLH
jgi:hypothetical protein